MTADVSTLPRDLQRLLDAVDRGRVRLNERGMTIWTTPVAPRRADTAIRKLNERVPLVVGGDGIYRRKDDGDA